MGNIIKVGMADLNVCKAPDGLTTALALIEIPDRK